MHNTFRQVSQNDSQAWPWHSELPLFSAHIMPQTVFGCGWHLIRKSGSCAAKSCAGGFQWIEALLNSEDRPSRKEPCFTNSENCASLENSSISRSEKPRTGCDWGGRGESGRQPAEGNRDCLSPLPLPLHVLVFVVATVWCGTPLARIPRHGRRQLWQFTALRHSAVGITGGENSSYGF